jgi:hypothetical protein
MGQFSVEKPVLPGSVLSGNQQPGLHALFWQQARQVSLILRMPLKRVTPSFTVEYRQAKRLNSGSAKLGWARAKPAPAGVD